MSARWRALLSLTTVAVVAAAGLIAGMQLGERASRPGTDVVSLDRPASIAPQQLGVRSAGGFTGFEAGALAGAVSRTGTATTSDGGQVVVESASARTEIRYSNVTRFFAIDASPRGPQPGDVIVVRLAPDGSAEAILTVPGDIREGDAR